MNQLIAKGLVIAGTHSGVGKTTVTLGILAALKQRGLRMAPFKVGPDFIDPGHHCAVGGKTSRNLDGWMLGRDYNRACFARHAAGADLAVVEGVMGLFDGFSGRDEAGSSAQMAKWLGLPVLLIVDAASMARSAAALVQGFERFDPELSFCGVLFNNVGSPGHLAYLQEALPGHVRMPCLGGMLRDRSLEMPERHLGLVTAQDNPLTEDHIGHLAQWTERHLNLDRLLAQLEQTHITFEKVPPAAGIDGPPATIALARDEAFCFYYQDNLDLLVRSGARLVPFSPLRDHHLPEGTQGIYLGGGYPELHAARLAKNLPLRETIARCSHEGMPIYGECGGFMYLCRELIDADGRSYPMTGCFPLGTRMQSRLRTLGYREITLEKDCLLGAAGSIARGHEFHYSDLQDLPDQNPIDRIYRVAGRQGLASATEGYRLRRTLGSYIHLHFGSNPQLARDFVQSVIRYPSSVKGQRPTDSG